MPLKSLRHRLFLLLLPTGIAVALFVCLPWLAAAGPDGPQGDQAISASTLPPGFIEEQVGPNLASPVGFDMTADGRIFVAQKHGVVRVIRPDGLLAGTEFINITSTVNLANDRGLLGFTLHPSFPISPYAYLLYTYDPPGVVQDAPAERVSRLIRVTVYPTNTSISIPGSAVVLLGKNSTRENIGDETGFGEEPSCDNAGVPIEDCVPSDGRSHSVGHLEFGNDGALYVSLGDGSNDTTMDVRALRSQNMDSPLGKILRIDPMTGEGLPTNPFFDSMNPARNRSKVWSYGLRNPYRFALHPTTNQIYIGDVGWGTWEELNSGRGKNFGWPCYEGNDSGSAIQPGYEDYAPTQAFCASLYSQGLGVVEPALYSYRHVISGNQTLGAAIVVGAFYTGTSFPAPYRGALFFGDYNNRTMSYALITETVVMDQRVQREQAAMGIQSAAASQISVAKFGDIEGGPLRMMSGPDGNLYYSFMYFTGSGGIRRIRAIAAGNTPPTAKISANLTNGALPLVVNFSSDGSFDPNGPITTTWSFGNGATSQLANPTYTYTVVGIYKAVLTVTDSLGESATANVQIEAGNTAPVPTIISPAATDTYNVGQVINLQGSAQDAEDGTLPGSSLSWAVSLHHNEHVHPDLFSATGSTASFTIPDHGDNTFFQICLTAVDSKGTKTKTCRDIRPNKVSVLFETQPSGLHVIYEGIAQTTPFTAKSVVNSQQLVIAPAIQSFRTFKDWSGAANTSNTLNVTMGPAPASYTYTASYFNQPPVAQIQANPVTGTAPLTVSVYAGLSSDPESSPLSVRWNFGDGHGSLSVSTTHVYQSSGMFTMTLVVSDTLGLVSTTTSQIRVGVGAANTLFMPILQRSS